jgi:uncharacterized protein involved in exopolysaccharide biosynthesis
VTAAAAGIPERRRYQLQVESLLEQIGRLTGRLELLSAGGARGPALEAELQGKRRLLARLVDRRDGDASFPPL